MSFPERLANTVRRIGLRLNKPTAVSEPLPPVLSIVDIAPPQPLESREQYRVDFEAFTQQPEIVDLQSRITRLGIQAEELAVKPERLREELEQVSLDRATLAAKLQGGHHSHSEIRETAALLDRTRRRESQIPREISETVRKEIPEAQWRQREAKVLLTVSELAWAKEGGEDRVVFYAAGRLKNDPTIRERLFREFAEQSGIPVNVLKVRFQRLAPLATEEDSVKPEPKPVSEQKPAGKRRRVGTVVSPTSVAGASPEVLSEPREIWFRVGLREPQQIRDEEHMGELLKEIDGIGDLSALRVLNKARYISSLDPESMKRYAIQPVGPYEGWHQCHVGKIAKMYFMREGKKFILTVGNRENLNRLRFN